MLPAIMNSDVKLAYIYHIFNYIYTLNTNSCRSNMGNNMHVCDIWCSLSLIKLRHIICNLCAPHLSVALD